MCTTSYAYSHNVGPDNVAVHGSASICLSHKKSGPIFGPSFSIIEDIAPVHFRLLYPQSKVHGNVLFHMLNLNEIVLDLRCHAADSLLKVQIGEG